jgi:hypothetical protein
MYHENEYNNLLKKNNKIISIYQMCILNIVLLANFVGFYKNEIFMDKEENNLFYYDPFKLSVGNPTPDNNEWMFKTNEIEFNSRFCYWCDEISLGYLYIENDYKHYLLPYCCRCNTPKTINSGSLALRKPNRPAALALMTNCPDNLFLNKNIQYLNLTHNYLYQYLNFMDLIDTITCIYSNNKFDIYALHIILRLYIKTLYCINQDYLDFYYDHIYYILLKLINDKRYDSYMRTFMLLSGLFFYIDNKSNKNNIIRLLDEIKKKINVRPENNLKDKFTLVIIDLCNIMRISNYNESYIEIINRLRYNNNEMSIIEINEDVLSKIYKAMTDMPILNLDNKFLINLTSEFEKVITDTIIKDILFRFKITKFNNINYIYVLNFFAYLIIINKDINRELKEKIYEYNPYIINCLKFKI